MESASEEKSTSSVSKGCFLFNPGSLQPTKTKKRQKKSSPPASHFITLPLESEQDAEKRHEAFLSCWSKLKDKIDVVITKQHDKVFADLLQFILSSNHQLDKLHQASTCKDEFRPPRLEIPTAVLIAGVNMPDHDVLFEQLRVMIRNGISPHVVLLKSSSCASGVKAAMKEILVQLSNGDQKAGQSSDVDETQSLSSPHKRPPLRLPLCSMDLLCKWYKSSCDAMQDQLNPAKPHPEQVKRPPVVIIVEDFESFSPPIMQDLIASISPHLPEFPVVLVLGVATSVRAIHRSLSRSASSLLCLEVFHTQHSTTTLQQIIEETLMDSFPFKLGPRVLQFLLHQFFYCNFSLVNFTSGLKFAVMEHFYWQPLSVLCKDQLEVDKKGIKVKFSHALCESIRATPSFQRFVESQEPKQQILLLEDDNELETVARTLLDKLCEYHKSSFLLLECLHIITKDLPNKSLGSKSYELYLTSLEQSVTEHPKFQEAWGLVKMMSQEELTACLQECIRTLESAKERDERHSKFLEQFSSYLSQLDSLQEHQPMDTDDPTPAVTAVSETTSERKMRFQERLRQVVSRKREPTAFELLRTDILESMLAIFKETLLCPSSLPLHEIVYFDNVTSMRKQLAPAPRASLQTALSTPHYYLPSAGHVTEQSGLDGNMPDVCIAYQLHLECGRLINLYDWLQAFVSVVEPANIAAGEKSSKKSSSRSKADAETDSSKEVSKKGPSKQDEISISARFIQAVSELQFLGFIKPTQRKTDHVQRLTWGAC